MNGITKTKAAVYLAAIFLAGLVAGGVAGFTVGRHTFFGPPTPGDMTAHTLARLKGELKLSDEQVRSIRPLVEQTSAELHALHTNSMGRVMEIIKQCNRRMEPFLTAEQRQKLAASERRFEQFGPKPPGPRPPHP